MIKNDMVHYGGWNGYTGNGNLKIACVPKRIKLPKGHYTTLNIKDVECPLCLQWAVEDHIGKIAMIKQMQKDWAHNLDTCQKGLKIEVAKYINFKPDPEVLERIRREL